MEAVIACLVCSSLVVLFLISLYFVDVGLPRNHPVTVRRRISVAIVMCGAGPSLLLLLLHFSESLSLPIFVSLLGIRWNGLLAAAIFPCVLVLILYTGNLVQLVLEGQSWRNVTSKRKDLILRDYIVAPFAEELIFRACMLTVLSPAFGDYRAIMVCPVFFGLAHLHHLIEWYRVKDGITFSQACLSVLLQVGYTSVFGLFSAFIFVRTQHLTGIVLAHSLCNVMGLPPVDEAWQHPNRNFLIASYFVGIIVFIFLLFPLTEPVLYYV